MNDQLQNFARQFIRDGLNKLPPDSQRIFKLMYGRNGGKRSVDDAVAMSIDDVVSAVPQEKLDWAMRQIENSLLKIS